ncbi:hypothetical protein [Methylobacterium oryzisoli]|uniref:hypothetical protein n=1 Tax=Methylobacterium oryzisoli TaxID=3385502 RepID=UPI003891CEEA
MSAHPAASPPSRRLPHRAGSPPARLLREGLDATARLLGFVEPRTDRAPADLTIRIGPPGDPMLAVIDRREEAPRTYRFEAGADDLAERLAAIGGGRSGARAKILVDPAACFTRSLVLPGAALPRMRALLAQELEAATPFRMEAVYADWYVEGEDDVAHTLLVRHVVLKRTRLDPLLAALAQAGLAAGPVTVGREEDQTMPVDLLSGGHRALPGFFAGRRAGDLVLVIGALLLGLAAYGGLRQHQERTLLALDEAFAAARRAAGPPAAPAIREGSALILSGRTPGLARSWDALAAALPDGASAMALRLDAAGLVLTLSAAAGMADEAAILAALGRVPGFAGPVLQDSAAGPDESRRLVVLLPRTETGGRP